MRTTLTEADLRVIRLYAQGFYQKQVAEQLGLSEITVKQRTRIISERLGMPLYTRMSDILIKCLREGIINLGVTMKSETVQTITGMLMEQGGDWFCNPDTYREFKEATPESPGRELITEGQTPVLLVGRARVMQHDWVMKNEFRRFSPVRISWEGAIRGKDGKDDADNGNH